MGQHSRTKRFLDFFLSPFDAFQTHSLEDKMIVYRDFLYWFYFFACSCNSNGWSNVYFQLCSQKLHKKAWVHSNPLKSYKLHFHSFSCWIRKSISFSFILKKKLKKKILMLNLWQVLLKKVVPTLCCKFPKRFQISNQITLCILLNWVVFFCVKRFPKFQHLVELARNPKYKWSLEMTKKVFFTLYKMSYKWCQLHALVVRYSIVNKLGILLNFIIC